MVMMLLHTLSLVSKVPVNPWPAVDQSSPTDFVRWLVNWDVRYFGNDQDLEAAINMSDPDIFDWDFGTENNRQHVLTRRGIAVSTHQDFEWQQTSGEADHNPAFARQFINNGYGVDELGELEPLHNDGANLSSFMSQVAWEFADGVRATRREGAGRPGPAGAAPRWQRKSPARR